MGRMEVPWRHEEQVKEMGEIGCSSGGQEPGHMPDSGSLGWKGELNFLKTAIIIHSKCCSTAISYKFPKYVTFLLAFFPLDYLTPGLCFRTSESVCTIPWNRTHSFWLFLFLPLPCPCLLQELSGYPVTQHGFSENHYTVNPVVCAPCTGDSGWHQFWKLSQAQRLRAAKLSTLSPRKSAECVLNAITMASYIICGAQEKCGAPCSHARGIMCSFLPWYLFWPVMASFICYFVSHSVPGGGHGSSLLGCLENPMGRRAWWATVLRVAEWNIIEVTEQACTSHSLGLGILPVSASPPRCLGLWFVIQILPESIPRALPGDWGHMHKAVLACYL